MNIITENAFRVMHEAEAMLLGGNVVEGLNNLGDGLRKCRANAETKEWFDFASNQFLEHPLVSIMHQDPFTRHSFIKPRKYPGDADLIDYMYGCRQPEPDTTELGLKIFDYTTNTPAPESVRERRKIIAGMIDEMAETNANLRVLSVACGHLREAAISKSVTDGKVKEFFALDQDALSLETVESEYAKFNVKTINSPIKNLFAEKPKFDDLDFVYASGLYDYLPQPVAIRLTRIMFDMLKPGGKMLAANFAPSLVDIAYLETFMQWNLVYRCESEVNDFASQIPDSKVNRKRTFLDSLGNVIYLEITKNDSREIAF